MYQAEEGGEREEESSHRLNSFIVSVYWQFNGTADSIPELKRSVVNLTVTVNPIRVKVIRMEQCNNF